MLTPGQRAAVYVVWLGLLVAVVVGFHMDAVTAFVTGLVWAIVGRAVALYWLA